MKDKIVNVICIRCPRGCEITVNFNKNGTIRDITGQTCKLGENYARKEISHPERVLTSTVRVSGGEYPVVSVWSRNALPKEKIFAVMDLLRKIKIKAPVEIGDVVLAHPLELPINIEASAAVKKLN